ncbi:hypothetical protein [Reichenbachiella ulvae]|uniref:HEAT repeat-containing protein n=1 Tax=Reichenbachiella ulvae TaxID=2980104 RepID=A0ABT3CRA4_9BACT|nr:hypothetical protein [Reichenbachiella ulvae]MCV9386101.1 hypothetical protein [Reichenbachiella ulvae]
MDLSTHLQGPVSKTNALAIKNLVFEQPELMNDLVDIFTGSDYRLCQNAAMAISKIGDEKPELFSPFIPQLIQSLESNPIDAVKRNVVRLLQFHSIPEELQGQLIQHCFDYLLDRQTPVAIRVFAMTIIGNLCMIYPDLKAELTLILKDEMPLASAGFRSRARRILKQIES